MMKGIAASNGIAIAKVFKFEQPVLTITRKEGKPEEEIAKLRSAIEVSIQEIETIKEKATGKLKDEELAIFDAHLAVANDPEFFSQVEDKINSENVNAEYAVEEVANMFIGIFESMDDEYMRARAADIKDVTFRIKAHICGERLADLSTISEEVVIVAEDLTPSDTAQLDKKYTTGFATEMGGRTSHSAIMARSLEIPAIVGVKELMTSVEHGQMMILDAINGEIVLDPTDAQIAEYTEKKNAFLEEKKQLMELKDLPSITADGVHVELAGNIGNPSNMEGVIKNGGDGVGLYRTEFLYMDASELPSEEDQFEAYKAVLATDPTKRVVIRTLDIGGDKKLPYLTIPPEMNPFLGYRAIRLCLDRKDIFRTQLRALIRASKFGRLGIMFPMIATLQEFRNAKAMFEEEKANLIKEGYEVGEKIELGMMVEIPAAAVLADQFAKEADFFSIGTNDLIQYSMAADRMSEAVSYLYQPYNPSILRLVKMTIDGAHKEGKWCGMCGEMAGDLKAIPLLLGLGLDEFSMSATSILAARKLVRSLKKSEMEELANKAIACSTMEEVLELVDAAVEKK
ncbi:MAG: phosphoenolpyruvate--protein phosphotransferase [Erysipelotrichales bacterium]|nr:phosphoenolpyruvate--protein phosphotransferase [Erysipelotrichales bacterium]